MANERKRKAVFVDRDGTLIKEVNFLSRVKDLEFFPFTDESVSSLKNAGFLVIVVTNQSGIGRGIYTEADMHSIHEEIQKRLSEPVDAFYFCPHLPDENCRCRKPNLGMIEQACSDFNIDIERSWMIGDKSLDILTGKNAGIRSAMVLTGYGREHVEGVKGEAEIVVADIGEAAASIIEFETAEARSAVKEG
jgi:D-glycero-D-manno-heptose 1,7-bisphosphate phosphatase